VVLRSDGTPVLDYRISPYLWEGVRRAYLAMAEIQFAAGANTLMPMHESRTATRSWREARAAIAGMPMRALEARIVTAHVMGGCAMGANPRSCVVDESGRHHQLANLSVHDGSIFPTSLGANPQVSIYALAARATTALLAALGKAAVS
jgi:choline dehydrogenase-like flavoprotein